MDLKPALQLQYDNSSTLYYNMMANTIICFSKQRRTYGVDKLRAFCIFRRQAYAYFYYCDSDITHGKCGVLPVPLRQYGYGCYAGGVSPQWHHCDKILRSENGVRRISIYTCYSASGCYKNIRSENDVLRIMLYTSCSASEYDKMLRSENGGRGIEFYTGSSVSGCDKISRSENGLRRNKFTRAAVLVNATGL